MNKTIVLLAVVAMVVSLALPMQASAELEELQVHGEIRIRGNYISPGFASRASIAGNPATGLGFDDNESNDDFYNALVEVNFTADMSDDVTGYIALRSYDIWGSDASDNIQGVDSVLGPLMAAQAGARRFTGLTAGVGNDAVGVYQAYIQMDNVGGYPISVKVGRQEVALGREFLMGNNDASLDFSGQAHDALRITYDNDESFMVTAFTAKALETRNLEQDGDIDVHGLYATYYGLEALDIDAYWLWWDNGVGAGVVTGAAIPGAAGNLGSESENLHTLGIRAYGTALDDRLTWNAEFAYQFGDVNGNFFQVQPGGGFFNPRSEDVEAWALNLMVGYTFDDVAYRPEVHAEYAWFSGDEDFTDRDHEAFTRLYSDVHYGKMNLGGYLDEQTTNMHILRVGASAEATDALTLHGDVLFFWLDEDDLNLNPGLLPAGTSVGGRTFGGFQWANAAGTGGSDNYVGTELDLWATWQYSEDLVLAAGWSHFFTGEAIETSFSSVLSAVPGFKEPDDDVDYLWWQAHLLF